MARKVGMEPEATVYRAVVTKPAYGTLPARTVYEGPYATVGAARARVTFWRNYYNGEASGHVEAGHFTWTPLEE